MIMWYDQREKSELKNKEKGMRETYLLGCGVANMRERQIRQREDVKEKGQQESNK